MKHIKFFTTFSNNGYNVYGKSWIDSFLAQTKNYNNITAKVYVNDMDLSSLTTTDKIEFVNFDTVMPEHTAWKEMHSTNARQDDWNKQLAVKFSYKSFTMLDMLRNTSAGYVIWLDADCIFTSNNFLNFPEKLLNENFLAGQREAGSEHVESGIVIFDAAHLDKELFIERFSNFYNTPEGINSFGQFFDGFIIGRTLSQGGVSYTDLNENYGIGGIQSDPSCTFLNPELKSRFYHNIGITGKSSYDAWAEFREEAEFRVIHGNGTPGPSLKDKLADVNNAIADILRRR